MVGPGKVAGSESKSMKTMTETVCELFYRFDTSTVDTSAASPGSLSAACGFPSKSSVLLPSVDKMFQK